MLEIRDEATLTACWKSADMPMLSSSGLSVPSDFCIPQNIAVVSAEEVCPVTEIYIAASLSHSLETRLQLVCIQCNGQVHSSTHIETITQCVRLK